MKLIAINEDGTVAKANTNLDETGKQVCNAYIDLYAKRGFEVPWIGYFAEINDKIIGTCGFTSPPKDNRVEIAYFTFLEFEGKGYATKMAQQLIKLSQDADSNLLLFAYTLPQKNASNTILSKLGFVFKGEFQHPEDGKVWEWHLQ